MMRCITIMLSMIIYWELFMRDDAGSWRADIKSMFSKMLLPFTVLGLLQRDAARKLSF